MRKRRSSPPRMPDKDAPRQDMAELQQKTVRELYETARGLSIPGYSGMRKQQMISRIMEAQSAEGNQLIGEGVLDILPDKDYGFLRSTNYSYLQSAEDIYVAAAQIRRYGLRTGHLVRGPIRPPQRRGEHDKTERNFALLKVESVNGLPPEKARDTPLCEDLKAVHPTRHLKLATGKMPFSTRIIDLMAPIGAGQRALIVAPPFAGKTHLLRDIAHGIETNHPDATLMVLLIDERPEEVTEMERAVKGEVISATFDEHPERHVAISQIAIERAKREAEFGRDVVVLLDSLTRLARAHNQGAPNTGRTLSGGIDAGAMLGPRKFLGAARDLEGSGSLTILATVLVDTNSRGDEYIYEELKGTANSEIHLNRELQEKRLYPALDVKQLKTRREEKLLDRETLGKITGFRHYLSSMSPEECIKLFQENMTTMGTNEEFIERLNT